MFGPLPSVARMPLVKHILNIVMIGDLDAGIPSQTRQIRKQFVSPEDTAELENLFIVF